MYASEFRKLKKEVKLLKILGITEGLLPHKVAKKQRGRDYTVNSHRSRGKGSLFKKGSPPPQNLYPSLFIKFEQRH